MELNYDKINDKLNCLTVETNPFNDLRLKEKIVRKSTIKLNSREFESLTHDDLIEKTIDEKATLIVNKEYHNMLSENFDNFSPLMYLSADQRKVFLQTIKFYKFETNEVLFTPNASICGNSAFILMEGEIHFYDKQKFTDLINYVCFFGYDGPIFKKRINKVCVEEGSVIGVIDENIFLENLKPFSKFCSFISSSIINKDKILDNIGKFKAFVLEKVDGNLDFKNLLELYKKMNPCLHSKLNSTEVDFSAWFYSLNRLPQNVLETFVFILVNKPPKVLFSKDDLAINCTPRILTKGRNRDVFKFLNGKSMIVVREMETDVLDFISNMCINAIECKKLRELISSPIILGKLFECKNDFNQVINILEAAIKVKLTNSDIENLHKFFGNNIGEKLINLCLHYEDYSILISKLSNSDQDPSEKWIQNLWKVARDLLGVTSSIEEMDDLVVDISQGSKRTLLGCISPHIFKNKEKIIKWGKENKIELKTKEFLSDTDILLAYSFYYYKSNPLESQEKIKMEDEHGIRYIEESFSTGIQVMIVDVNKLSKEYCDPAFRIKPASKNHIILHFGYTFGAQSSFIIKPILMLFGSKARSMNIVGKAGGLTGNRTDILVSSNIFYDKTNELININYGNLDIPKLEKDTKSKVHLGAMLNVAGTIIQNNDLLNFYKHVQGCIGVEMEGYFFAREIENCIKHGILRKDFITRCFYYASDLPLDPNQNLAQEDGNVSWDEGVCSMNAIERYIMGQIFA